MCLSGGSWHGQANNSIQRIVSIIPVQTLGLHQLYRLKLEQAAELTSGRVTPTRSVAAFFVERKEACLASNVYIKQVPTTLSFFIESSVDQKPVSRNLVPSKMQNLHIGAGPSSAEGTRLTWSKARDAMVAEAGHEATFDLLDIIMFMDQSNIPNFSFIVESDTEYPNTLQQLRRLRGRGALDQAADTLIRFEQMARDNVDGTMSLINPGLHTGYYAQMSTSQKHFPHLAALFILLILFPGEPRTGQDMPFYLGNCEARLPHIEKHLVRAMESEMAMSADSANLAMNAIRYVSEIGQLRQLRKLLSILRTVCSKFKADKHGLTLADEFDVQAWAHVKLVRQAKAPTPKDAIAVTEKALKYRRTVLKNDDPAIAASLGNLAVFTIATAQYKESLEYSKLCLEMLLKNEPNETEKISRTYLYYGWCYAKMKKPVEAKENFERALGVMEERFANDAFMKPQTIWAHYGLGNLYQSYGREKEALEQHEKAYKIARDLYGRLSPGVFTTWYKIIWYYAFEDDKSHHIQARDEAEEMLREMQKNESYDGHIARTEYLLAVILEKLDKPAESKALRDKAYETGKILNGPEWKPLRGKEDFKDFDELVFFHDR